MFGNRKNFNLNFDELITNYEKIMGDLHKNGCSQESYESQDGSYKFTSYVKIFDSSDFDKSKKMSKEEYLKTNPNIQSHFSTFPGIGDSVRLGIKKPDVGWKEVLQKIDSRAPGSTLKDHSTLTRL